MDVEQVIEMLQDKFRAMEYDTVTDWVADNKVDLSLQACTSVILRGKDQGIITMLTLASALGCSPEEIREVAKAKGDKTLWRLVAPESISKADRELLDGYNKLSLKKQRVVTVLIELLQEDL